MSILRIRSIRLGGDAPPPRQAASHTAACAILILLTSALSAQSVTEEGVDEAVARLTSSMGRGSADSIWDSVMKLKGYGNRGIDAIEASFAGAPPVAQLGLAASLGELEEHESAIDRAFTLLSNKEADTDTRIVAAQLIGRYGLFVDDREFSRTVGARLEDFLDDPFHPVPLKVAASQALYDSTGNPRGRKNLQAYLKSDDIVVRNMAALGLAELGQFMDPDVKDVLRSFQDEPGSRGRLARTFLDLDYYQKQLELAEHGRNPGARASDAGGDSRWPLLSELEDKLKKYHIYGDTELASHERLVARAAKGMLEAMDRHSTWYTAKEYREFMEDLNKDYGGIGAYVGFRGEPPVFTILRPIYSGPAYQVGLRSRDVIWEVDGWPTDGKTIEEIIKRLKGTPGTTTSLTIFRPGWKTERKYDVVRGHITIASVQGSLLPGDIGYISLSTFSDDTADELVKLLSSWQDAGSLSGIILDLRNNGGGYLDTAREVADQFLPKGTLLVYSEGSNPEMAPRQDLKAAVDERFPNIPMVVLINGSSASASEIVTGALKVYKRATVVGMRSFGKGSVQKAIPVDTDRGGRLRLTIARYYLPDGTSIHKEIDADGAVIKGKEGGIDPDILVDLDSTTDIRDAEEITRLQQLGVQRDYIDKHLENGSPESVDLFDSLVKYGETRGQHWPDFDIFYDDLKTSATKESVKSLLRIRATEVLQDHNGQEYIPLAPIDLDEQLQVALVEVWHKAKIDISTLPGMAQYQDKYDKVIATQDDLRKRYTR